MERIEPRIKKRRQVFSWALYDFANTIYTMNVVTMYFSLWITVDHGWEDIWVSGANSLSMLMVALSMPVLGAISDQIQRRMPFLIGLTLSCVLCTILIGLVGRSGVSVQAKVLAALIFYMAANYSYQGGLVFYDTLLPQVSTPKNMGRISGLGTALGYLGAIVGLILVMPFNQGSVFGLTIPFIKGGGRAATFVPTGLLFLFFSLPAFFFLRDQASSQVARTRVSWGRSLRQVLEVLEHSSRYPGVIRFLLAKFFYENAISAVIIFMAVYAVKAMGFSDAVVMPFFIVSTASAVVGSTICGTITDRLGPLRTLKVVLVGWMASLCLVLITSNQWIFWGVGSLVGIFLGATWTTARPLLVTMVPEKMLGEFFGLYAFSGKAAAIFGPLIWGLVVMIFQEHEVLKYKLAVGSMVLLIGVGLAVLWQLPRERAKESA